MRRFGIVMVAAACVAAVAVGCAHCPVCGTKGSTGKKESCGANTAREATISTEGLAALLNAKATAAVVDARTAKWDDGKRIAGAKRVEPTASEAEITAALPDKNALVVAYCSNTKCQASHELAARLRDLGYKNVVRYPDGIAGWVEAGHEVTEVTK